MPRNRIYLLGLLALMGALGLYANRDWFSRRPIQISHRLSAFGGRFGGDAPEMMFEFDRRLKLTSVKVVPAEVTNRAPHAFWYLVSDSNSVPTKGFLYGMKVPGMHPAVKGLEPEALEPDQKYRLLLEAGSTRAEHVFELTAPGS